MQLIGKNIYANFTLQDIPDAVTQKVRAVVMGYCGNGKTSLFNNLCDTKYSTGSSLGSLTRDIAYEDVIYKPKLFRIYDTPGSDSQLCTIQCALLLRASLVYLPINLIMINARLDTRYARSLKEFKAQINIFQGQQKFVVYLLSCLDQLDQQVGLKQKIFKEILDELKKKKSNTNFKLIAYSNKISDFEALSNILYKLGSSNEQQYIKIDDKRFYKYFNISNPIQNQTDSEIGEYLQKIKDQAEIFIEHVKKLNENNTNNAEMISDLKQFMKYHLKQLQKSDYNEYSQKIKDVSRINDLFLAISQIIQAKLQEFEQASQKKYQKKFYNQKTSSMTDIRHLMKECPKCQTIWMKTVGCSHVICGSKTNIKDYLRVKSILRYEFKIQNGKITHTQHNTSRYYNIIMKQQQRKKLQAKLFESRKKLYQIQSSYHQASQNKEQQKEASNLYNKYQQLTKQYSPQQNEYNKFEQLLRKQQQQMQKQRKLLTQSDTKPLGCGHQFQWDAQPPSQRVELKLRQLFGVSNFEQIKFDMNWLQKNHPDYYNQLGSKIKKYQNQNQQQNQKYSHTQSHG